MRKISEYFKKYYRLFQKILQIILENISEYFFISLLHLSAFAKGRLLLYFSNVLVAFEKDKIL